MRQALHISRGDCCFHIWKLIVNSSLISHQLPVLADTNKDQEQVVEQANDPEQDEQDNDDGKEGYVHQPCSSMDGQHAR